MDCSECKGLLSQYIDSELPDGSRRALEEHLSSCAECTQLLDELRSVDTITHQTIELQRPPGDFPRKILADLPPEGPSSRWQLPIAFILLVLLVIVVAASILVPILTRPRLARDVAVFHMMELRSGVPADLEVPFDLMSRDPVGLQGPDVIIAFRGHIEVTQPAPKALSVKVHRDSVVWLRVGHATHATCPLPDGIEAGPVKQALIDTTLPETIVHNLWKEPLRLGASEIPPGFRGNGTATAESDPSALASSTRPFMRFLPKEASFPLDWLPANLDRGPRRVNVAFGASPSARLIGEVPAGRPLALTLTATGDTILVPAVEDDIQPPFVFTKVAWPLNDLLAVFAGPEGRFCGLARNGDLFSETSGRNTKKNVLDGLETSSILYLPLQGRLVLHSPSGVTTLSILEALAYWTEPRLKDCVGALSNGKGNVWLAQRDGTLTLLGGTNGEKKAVYGPIGQTVISAPVRFDESVCMLGERGRLLIVHDDGSSEMRDIETGGEGHEGFTASSKDNLYFIRNGTWYRAGEKPVALGTGGKEALLLGDSRVLAAGENGLKLLPEDKTLVGEGPGGFMVGTEGIYYITLKGRVYLLSEEAR